ncbi:hypothetical protein DPMN_129092 [Dreissena polymorpha]|uniref:Uncharacterized protein n=1 Tax=Dreissena polymorpha TaxID=45954 RepID=A0A9D4K0R8_DREPO|nr:hypothetical protein DPMN_129092 [Dreissena polymorpha]
MKCQTDGRTFAHMRGFHDDCAKNVTSRVHVIKLTGTIFKPNSQSHIKETKIVFTLSQYTYREKCPAHWRPYINKTNVLTNFHDDWAKTVTSRVFTSHVFQLAGTIFKLNSHIKETNVLTKFHENWAKNVTSKKNAPPTGGHVFSPIRTIFELVQDINKTNVLTNFHDNWAKIVTSRVFTRFLYSQIGKTAPPTGGHVFQRTGTTFELNQHIIKTNILTNFELDRDFMGTKLLTKFHEDRTRNVASRVFTNQMWTTDGRTDKDQSQKLT